MRTVVVYESLFGSTREIAEAIRDGIRDADPSAEIDLIRTGEGESTAVAQADLLIVGGPTHMHGMSSGMSRKMGLSSEQKKAEAHPVEPGAEGPGIRDFLHQLPKVNSRRAAAFDTRGEGRMAGGAAHGISRRLHSHGYEVTGAEGFIVEEMAGPLRTGERDRARAWAAGLMRQLVR
ncbi:MAG TPA: flavodoxin [Micromonosporaceae bacterium]